VRAGAIIGLMDRVRIDKWLWAARFYKTRSLATEAVAGGRVHVNGDRVKPARELRVGETIEITLGGGLHRTVVVDALSDKRGPASAAQQLYTETADSIAERERALAERRAARPLGADLGARPTKLDRRRLDALRRAQRRGK
jgi:ribosome-associated heat shock protein Hsp15